MSKSPLILPRGKTPVPKESTISTRKTTTTTQSGQGSIVAMQSQTQFYSGRKTYLRRSTDNTKGKNRSRKIFVSDVYGEEIDDPSETLEPLSAPALNGAKLMTESDGESSPLSPELKENG